VTQTTGILIAGGTDEW